MLLLLLLSGTPGRVYDMISRRALKLDDVKLFVLDEADEMLSRGFKEQIYDGNVCMEEWMYKCMYVCTYVKRSGAGKIVIFSHVFSLDSV